MHVCALVHMCVCVCMCVCMCAYLAASVCANACLSTGVSVWPGLRLQAIMSGAAVAGRILSIASDPRASSPQQGEGREGERVTQPKSTSLATTQRLHVSPATELQSLV